MSLRILIVDDDKHTCRILQTLISRDPPLRERGVQVAVAGDGERGLKALDEGPADLVISDLLMPGMDGFAFCRELRRRPGCEQVPLIVSSAVYKDAITIRKLKVEVGAEFFTKPFQVAEMIAAVRRMVGVAGGQPADREPKVEAPPLPSAGTLRDHPLPRLLLDHFEARSTACLHLQRGELRRKIHLRMGHVITVDSNSRGDALGTYLLERELLSEQRLCEALAISRDRRLRLGQVLVEQGWLGEAQLLQEMEAQMRRRLATVLRWQDASFRLESAGTAYEPITLQGGTPALTFAALLETARPDELAESRGRLPGPLCPTRRAARLREAYEGVFGVGTLAILDRQPLLGELLAPLPAPARDAMLVRVDAMLLCGLATAERASAHAAGREPHRATLLPSASPIAPGTIEVQVQGAAPRPEVERLDPRHRQLLSEYLAADGRSLYELLDVQRDGELSGIQIAYHAALERLSPERFSDLDLGRDHGKISELRERYRHALHVLSSPARRASYDRDLDREALELNHRVVHAELLFRKGQVLLGTGQLADALSLFDQAAAQTPEQADYHALLGWARFLMERHAGSAPRQAAQAAWPHFQRALMIDEGHLHALAYLGHIHAALGEINQAADYFERVLERQPERRDVMAGLDRMLEHGQHFARLGQCYRKIIRRLDPGQAAQRRLLTDLWTKLAVLCEDKLRDPKGALEAVDALSELAQGDLALQAWALRLRSRDLLPWQKEAAMLGEAWRRDPGDAAAGAGLLQLYRAAASGGGARYLDAAYLCAAVLSLRGQADEAAQGFYERHRPLALSRAKAPLTEDVLRRLRHPADSPALEQLALHLQAAAAPAEPQRGRPWSDAQRLTPETVPADFGRVALYISQACGLSWPPLFCADLRDGDGVLSVDRAAGRPLLQVTTEPAPAVAFAPEVLHCKDHRAIAFQLGRLAALLRPGRAFSLGLQAAQLKTLALAAIAVARPSLLAANDAAEALRLTPAPVVARLAQAAAEIGVLLDGLPGVVSWDAEAWQRALDRTADHVGLLLCGDVEAAARQCQERAPEDLRAAEDLLEFALDEAHLAARDALGLRGVR